eukprot:Skav202257  [mRNA]  locus=scaffold1417:369747:372166:+ [translate_table: standard]
MEDSVLWFCIVTLLLGFALKLIFLAVSLFSERSSFSLLALEAKRSVFQHWRWWKQPLDGRSQQQLDQTRCSWTRVLWRLAAAIAMFRLIVRQVRGREDTTPWDWNWSIVAQAIFGLVLTSFPQLINPRCQDFWYVVVMVTIDASIIAQALIGGVVLDARDAITFFFAGRFIYAVLAKRTRCVVFCITMHLLQAIYLARSSGEMAGTVYSGDAVLALFLLMLGSIICVRRLLRENVSLKVDLHERTVELGAVSSLLTACYDAVFEVDDELKLTQVPERQSLSKVQSFFPLLSCFHSGSRTEKAEDSRQLSSMLLCGPRPGGFCGEALLGFFCERDQARISELLNGEGRSVVALNADMLDSDHNLVKVELFSVQFKNLANETCFLMAVREIQHSELCAQAELGVQVAQVPSQISDISISNQDAVVASDETLLAVFDLYDFEVFNMSGKLQQLCQQKDKQSQATLRRPKHPHSWRLQDDILDIASHDTRLSLNNQLQILVNSFAAHADVEDGVDLPSHSRTACVSFNFLGLWEARGSLKIEYDQVLESWVASMVIERVPSLSTLTLKNLQDFNRNPVEGPPEDIHSHSFGAAAAALGHTPRSLRSSNCSCRSSRQSSRRRKRSRVAVPSQCSGRCGSICDLHPKLRL